MTISAIGKTHQDPESLSPHSSKPLGEASAERHLRFRPDIEGLRAVAIVLVVLYHAGWRGARSGFLGVDVFFVLSGFLITGLLLDEALATGTVALTQFWARRARRLLPAAAFITLVVLVASAVWLDPFDQRTFADTARAFAVYGSNILFAVRSTDYFGGAAVRDPLLHTWSLSVEEQFYLFFAPAMLVLAMWARSAGAATMRRRFAIATLVVTVLSLGGCLLLVRRYPVIAFYALPARAWEFGLGALAVLAVQAVKRIAPLVLDAIALVGLACVVGSAALLRESSHTLLGITTLVPTLGTVALIVSGAATHRTLVARALSLGPLRLIGRLSYSWYLWHWPALVYLRARVPNASTRLSVLVAVLSLAPAALAYVAVESPVRFSASLRRRPRQVVAAAAALALLMLAVGTTAGAWSRHVLRTPAYAEILAARVPPRIYDDGCQVPLLAVDSPPCTYGPGRNDTTVVLFGDSHAAQWFPAMDSIAVMRGWTLVNLTKRGCPSISVLVPNAKLGRRYLECEAWRRYAIARIVALHPALVVVANARSYEVILGTDQQQQHTDSSAVARREWHDGLRRTLDGLAPSGARLAVIEDSPRAPFDIPRCLVRNVHEPSRCSFDVRAALDPAEAAMEQHAVAMVPGTQWISLNSQICDPVSCPAVRDGVVRLQDDNHLSARFAASLAPALSHELTRVLATSSTTRRP